MFVCVLCAFILCLHRVEAGKNNSTVIPASRKGRKTEREPSSLR
jgi:hypothetical protein